MPELLERNNPSQSVAIVGGRPRVVEVVEQPASLELTIGGVVATIGGISGAKNPLALNDSSEVEVTTTESLRFSLEGLRSKSEVDLWLYARDQEKQKFLGTFSTDGDGVLVEDVSMHADDLTGSDRKSTRLNSSHVSESRMPSSA